jgi:hypothetical protein
MCTYLGPKLYINNPDAVLYLVQLVVWCAHILARCYAATYSALLMCIIAVISAHVEFAQPRLNMAQN